MKAKSIILIQIAVRISVRTVLSAYLEICRLNWRWAQFIWIRQNFEVHAFKNATKEGIYNRALNMHG